MQTTKILDCINLQIEVPAVQIRSTHLLGCPTVNVQRWQERKQTAVILLAAGMGQPNKLNVCKPLIAERQMCAAVK